MQKISLILYPPFVQEHLNNKSIAPENLGDCEKLSTILSEYSVNKILYLNDGKVTDPSKCCDVLNLGIFKSYVANNSFGEDVKSTIPHYTVGNSLNALCKVGDEAMVPVLEKNLHNYHLPFKVLRIKPKIYAVIFQPLCEVDSPRERSSKYLKDMEGLLSEISLELNDVELLEEDIYQQYLSLI